MLAEDAVDVNGCTVLLLLLLGADVLDSSNAVVLDDVLSHCDGSVVFDSVLLTSSIRNE